MKKTFSLTALSVRNKLVFLSVSIILPFIILTGLFIYNLNRLAASYDLIVKNITNANEYNTVFKEEIDSVMYQMVARSLGSEEVEEAIGMKNPERMIDEAEDK